MEDMLLAFLGPYKNLILGAVLVVVVLARKSIRKRHIVLLLVATVVAAIGFFALLLWSFTWYKGQKTLPILHAALGLLAGVVVGCGAGVGFSFILKSLGLASLEDPEPRFTGRRGRS